MYPVSFTMGIPLFSCNHHHTTHRRTARCLNNHFSRLGIHPRHQSIANNGANQFEIKAAITIPDSITIRSGYSANAEMTLDEVHNVLAVPESAVEYEGDSTFVYVLTDSLHKQKFERHSVETGISDGIKIEIKQGLQNNDRVRGLRKTI